jgi:hypothetical protein
MSDDELERKIREGHEITETRVLARKGHHTMKARITLTVHDTGALGHERLGALAGRCTELFDSIPTLKSFDLIVTFTTDNHTQAIRQIETFNLELARKFSSDCWTSVQVQEIQ